MKFLDPRNIATTALQSNVYDLWRINMMSFLRQYGTAFYTVFLEDVRIKMKTNTETQLCCQLKATIDPFVLITEPNFAWNSSQ